MYIIRSGVILCARGCSEGRYCNVAVAAATNCSDYANSNQCTVRLIINKNVLRCNTRHHDV